MKKIIILLIELFIITLSLYGINYFVVEILNPDYTVFWENYTGPGITPNVEANRAEVMKSRNFDRIILCFIFTFLVMGYYCGKKGYSEMKKRKTGISFDIIQSNRKIAAFRFASILLVSLFILSFIGCISSHPMKNMTETGVAITNPLFSNNWFLKLAFCMYMPVILCLAPYFTFKGLTNVFTLKFCMVVLFTLVVVIAGTMLVVKLLNVKYPRVFAQYIISGLNIPILVNYVRKMDEVAKILGMGK